MDHRLGNAHTRKEKSFFLFALSLSETFYRIYSPAALKCVYLFAFYFFSQVGGQRRNGSNRRFYSSRMGGDPGGGGGIRGGYGRQQYGGGGGGGVSSPTFSVRSWDSHACQGPNSGKDDEYGGGGGGGGAPGPPDDHDDGGGGAAAVDEADGGEDEDVLDRDLERRFPSARSLQAILCYCDASTLAAPRVLLRILLLVRQI